MGQFNSGYRRPNFSGSKDFYSPSNSSLSPVPASQPKSKTKQIIIILSIGIVLVSALVIISTMRKSNSSEDAWIPNEAVSDLRGEYKNFKNLYEACIGMEPSVRTYDTIIIGECAPELNEALNSLKEAYDAFKEVNGLSDKKQSVEEYLDQNIPVFEKNIQIMNEFYAAFEELVKKIQTDWKCEHNEKIENLKQSENEYIKTSSQLYEKYFCTAVETYDVKTSNSEFENYILTNESVMEEIKQNLNLSMEKIKDERIEDILWKMESENE